MFCEGPTPDTSLTPVLSPAPHASSQAVGILSSNESIPLPELPWLKLIEPKLPNPKSIVVVEYTPLLS